jgi:hypothetical protein
VAPPYASTACVQTLGVAPPSTSAARLDPLDAAPPAVAAVQLRCDAAAPSSALAAGLGRLDAATPVAVATRHWGDLDVGHLDVEASVGEGVGRELKCIGGVGDEVIDDLGRPILVFITLTG